MLPRSRRLFSAIGALLVTTSLGVAAPGSAASGEVLQQVVDRLGSMAPLFDSYPDAVLAISVTRLDTGERASFRGEERLGPASAVKAVWVLAAIEHSGVSAVEPIVRDAVYYSDDVAAGTAIDLAGGLDAINGYIRGLGMADTDFYEWNFPREHVRRSSTYPGPMRGRNLTTTDDLVTFWRLVAEGGVLDPVQRARFLEWVTGLKAGGDANRIVARLPAEVRAAAAFKSGWLPLGREWQLPDTPDGKPGETIILEARGVAVGAGIMSVPGGPDYVIAVAAFDGRSWGGMTAWTEYASCVVFSVIAEQRTDCSRPSDPDAIARHLAPPSGELLSVVSRSGFLVVDGWASDPDAWMTPTLVRFTVDGVRFGGMVPATPREAAQVFRPRFHATLLEEPAPGVHEVCAQALDDGGGDPVAIGCHSVMVGS